MVYSINKGGSKGVVGINKGVVGVKTLNDSARTI